MLSTAAPLRRLRPRDRTDRSLHDPRRHGKGSRRAAADRDRFLQCRQLEAHRDAHRLAAIPGVLSGRLVTTLLFGLEPNDVATWIGAIDRLLKMSSVSPEGKTITFNFNKPWADFPQAVAGMMMTDPYKESFDEGAKSQWKVLSNGPYKVEGPVRLIDAEGREFVLPEGETIALCRCGASTTKPFCDGTHSKAGFKAAQRAVGGNGGEVTN